MPPGLPAMHNPIPPALAGKLRGRRNLGNMFAAGASARAVQGTTWWRAHPFSSPAPPKQSGPRSLGGVHSNLTTTRISPRTHLRRPRPRYRFQMRRRTHHQGPYRSQRGPTFHRLLPPALLSNQNGLRGSPSLTALLRQPSGCSPSLWILGGIIATGASVGRAALISVARNFSGGEIKGNGL